MAWTVTTKWIYPPNWDENPPPDGHQGSRLWIVQLTGESGAASEEDTVRKIDISELRTQNGLVPTRCIIEEIRYDTKGLNFIRFEWDRQGVVGSPEREIAIIPGVTSGKVEGPLVDPNPGDNNGVGNTGDIMITTDGGADGSVYNIQLVIKPKATFPVTPSNTPG